jgi:hypothetical protein
MKINKLEIAKTISDFLFLWVDNPEEKAQKIFEVRHRLDNRWHWFEKYMQYYFNKIHKFEVKVNWETNSFDWWIDLKWIKKKNWKVEYLVVQCKNYSIKDITEIDIKNFFASISLNEYSKYKNDTKYYFITTSKFTESAKIFAKKSNIILVGFEKILELQEIYSLSDFKIDLLKKEWKKEIYKSFSKEQLELKLNDNLINTIQAKDKEVFQLLKQVRRDLSNLKQLRLWDIAKNDTLELLARERPHNLEALKNITNTFTTREKNKLNKYWEEFIKRLKYLHRWELKVEVAKKDSFLKKLLNF